MAEAKQKSGVAIGACLALLFQVSSAATSHTVGDSTGWTIPSTSSLYTTWASKQTFQVGDFLVFNFQSGAHTVAEMTKSAYDSCGTANPITQVNNSPANLTITSSGTHYYICTISGHCLAGQKLSITATSAPAAKSTPSPAASPAPSPKSSPATAPTPFTAAPTHAPSSASPTPAPTPTAAPSSATPTPASTPTAAPTPGPSASPTAAPEIAPTPAPGVVAPTTASSPAASGPPASGPSPPSPPSPAEEPTRSTPNSPSSASSAVAALMLPLLVIVGANFLY